jgi:hypothetical protein
MQKADGLGLDLDAAESKQSAMFRRDGRQKTGRSAGSSIEGNDEN